jgi:hypothetical protein
VLKYVGLKYPARGSLRSLCREDGDAVSGFEAVMNDGAIITYQATPKEARMKAGSISIIGEVLLVERHPDGIERGLALGCREFMLAGRLQKIDKPNFEFIRKDAAVEIVAPIRYQDESP